MIRAGVPETAAMRITGHKTRAMLDRYNVTSTDDMKDAILKTAASRAAKPAHRNILPFPSQGAAQQGAR